MTEDSSNYILSTAGAETLVIRVERMLLLLDRTLNLVEGILGSRDKLLLALDNLLVNLDVILDVQGVKDTVVDGLCASVGLV